jgi:O-methyltransferase involved in polyketide biosynthesis
MASLRVNLDPVPETLLWTLYHRSVEARRRDRVLDDPLAVDLVARIEFPFAERFGDGGSLSQWQALRARTFDDEIERFLAAHPHGTVAALGEGLETQSWRVDNNAMRWITIDLPEVIELRQQLLPRDPRRQPVAASVVDHGWLDSIDAGRHVLFTAQGLLMYLQRRDVHSLIARLAHRHPQSALLFDTIPAWLLEGSRTGKLALPTGYQPPLWRWALDGAEQEALKRIPNVATLHRVPIRRGRGAVHGVLLPALGRLPILSRQLLSIWRADFGNRPAAPRQDVPKRSELAAAAAIDPGRAFHGAPP